MTSYFPMVKNAAQRIVFPILDADGDLVAGAANLDSEYSLDGGVFTDCTNEATNITSGGANSGVYYLDLVAGETNGGLVCIQVKTSTADAKTTVLVFYTSTQSLDTVDANVDAVVAKLPTNFIMGSSVQTDKDDEIDTIKSKTDNLPVDPADESLLEAEINANETKIDAIQTDVTAIKGYVDTEIAAILAAVDTEIAAIKAVTDTLSLATIADAVLDEVVDANNPANANSLREVVNVMSAALAGKSSGGGTPNIAFRDLGDTKNRVSATVDPSGNRTATTNDGT